MALARILISFALAATLAACGGPGDNATVPEAQPAGATSADIGDYVVHFSAQSTDQLPPDIARAYNIVRSKNRAMLNVSIIRESDNTPVSGNVTVKTVNLTGQLKNVTMRKIEEPGDVVAIYYIGETPVANRETLIFDISVQPEGAERSSEVRFKRQFYTDS
ncbi:MAG: DUF4426 domain-containing protein [Woeseiaceae bacterium]|nr:DUF4426 domain-containing protein [Woeseiaceae bacterium]